MSAYFTNQNTTGYSIAELAELNVRFNASIADIDVDNKSAVDHLSETILASFDDEQALKAWDAALDVVVAQARVDTAAAAAWEAWKAYDAAANARYVANAALDTAQAALDAALDAADEAARAAADAADAVWKAAWVEALAAAAGDAK
jgi:hypothetical protein